MTDTATPADPRRQEAAGYYMPVRAAVRQHLRLNKISVNQLARWSGVSGSTLRKWLRPGHNVQRQFEPGERMRLTDRILRELGLVVRPRTWRATDREDLGRQETAFARRFVAAARLALDTIPEDLRLSEELLDLDDALADFVECRGWDQAPEPPVAEGGKYRRRKQLTFKKGMRRG